MIPERKSTYIGFPVSISPTNVLERDTCSLVSQASCADLKQINRELVPPAYARG